MPRPRKVKVDPPELESKSIESMPMFNTDEKVKDTQEPDIPNVPVSPEIALLIEQNRMLMEKLEALTPKEAEKVVGNGDPILDRTKPITGQRGEGYAYDEQDGHKFTKTGKYMGPV